MPFGIQFSKYIFQSTPPKREATPAIGGYIAYILRFQSTPPKREATIEIDKKFSGDEFQSTPPKREATHDFDNQHSRHRISIHTSQAGGDMG